MVIRDWSHAPASVSIRTHASLVVFTDGRRFACGQIMREHTPAALATHTVQEIPADTRETRERGERSISPHTAAAVRGQRAQMNACMWRMKEVCTCVNPAAPFSLMWKSCWYYQCPSQSQRGFSVCLVTVWCFFTCRSLVSLTCFIRLAVWCFSVKCYSLHGFVQPENTTGCGARRWSMLPPSDA